MHRHVNLVAKAKQRSHTDAAHTNTMTPEAINRLQFPHPSPTDHCVWLLLIDRHSCWSDEHVWYRCCYLVSSRWDPHKQSTCLRRDIISYDRNSRQYKVNEHPWTPICTLVWRAQTHTPTHAHGTPITVAINFCKFIVFYRFLFFCRNFCHRSVTRSHMRSVIISRQIGTLLLFVSFLSMVDFCRVGRRRAGYAFNINVVYRIGQSDRFPPKCHGYFGNWPFSFSK